MRTDDNILENVIRLQGQEANAAERDLRGECIAPAAIPPNIRNGPDYGLGRTRRSLQLRQLLSFQQRTIFRREALWSPECPQPPSMCERCQSLPTTAPARSSKGEEEREKT